MAETFESTIVLARVGEDPAIAAAVVHRVIQWARDVGTEKFGLKSVKVERASVVLAGDMKVPNAGNDLRLAMGVLGAELKAIVARGRPTPATLPKSAEDAT